MGISPLQINQVLDWLKLRGIDDREAIEEYAYYIFELDAEYIDFMSKKQNNQITQTSHLADRK